MEDAIQNQVSLILGKYGWLFIAGVLTLLFRGTIEKFVSKTPPSTIKENINIIYDSMANVDIYTIENCLQNRLFDI